ncbi:MAG: hypothetical protein IJO13_06965 [Lachnospiraceae bacterium]|nr:hypothetical protein [Lachnospiraceae bacterium]
MASSLMRTTEKSMERGLLYEYLKVLTGEVNGFSSYILGKKSTNAPKNAKLICKMAFEIFLRWTPDDVANRLTYDIIKELKLDNVIPYLDLPDDYFNSGDYTQLAAEIYPGQLSISERTLVTNTYKMVLLGKENGGMYRFPKKYFDGNIGLRRAHICFQYLLSNFTFFHSTKEMYEYFASPAGTHLINEKGLKLVLRDVFDSPVRYLHESLPEEDRDEFWYHYYNFRYWYEKERKIYDQCKKIEGKEQEKKKKKKS